MYDIIQGFATVVFLVFFTLYGKNFNISRIKSFILGMVGMVIYLLLVKFLAWAETGFEYFGSENAIRVYVVIPVFIYMIARIAKVDPLKLCDMYAVSGVLMYGVGHIACVFGGCCHGFEYYRGTTMSMIANALTGTNMLPMQIFESLTALLVFAVLCIVGHRRKYETKGRLLCLWYILFGTSRFFWEFLRDNTKVIIFAPMKQADGYLGLSTLAIWAAAMAVAGVVLYYVFKAHERRMARV